MIALRNTHFVNDCFLLSFKNGQVGIYDFKAKKFIFMTEPNHCETIFDLKFKRSDKNILATGAYDGNIRIWDVNKMKCLKNL